MKQEQTESRFAIDPGCPICCGRGMLPVPDYEMIGMLKQFDQCMANDWAYVPKKATYCPVCFADYRPVDRKSVPYNNLATHIKWVRFQSADYTMLLKSLLRWHFSAIYNAYHADQIINSYFEESGQ